MHLLGNVPMHLLARPFEPHLAASATPVLSIVLAQTLHGILTRHVALVAVKSEGLQSHVNLVQLALGVRTSGALVPQRAESCTEERIVVEAHGAEGPGRSA